MMDRFPPEVAEALAAAGWAPDRRDDTRGRDWALHLAAHVTPDGRRHTVVRPAVEAYAEFGGLRIEPAGPGEEIAPSSVCLDPFVVVNSMETLAALAEATGAPLTPLGEEGDGTGILAVDERGRVFVLDHTGEWYLGESVDEALTTLLLGRRPSRVREDGTW